jgi:HprK-related kinase A
MTLMPLGEFAPTLVENSLRGSGVCIAVGTFLCRIHSDTGLLSEPLLRLYSSYPASIDCNLLVDFEIDVRSIRSRHGREVEFHWEGKSPFPALPLSQTHPLFEWGLNWAIATLSGSDIVIHSAVVEKNGIALALPGDPGAGKSTLCAMLALSDWRLLSDELTIIDRQTLKVRSIPRPISLKDQSIRLIKTRFPDTYMTEPISETRKGDIAYAKPHDSAVLNVDQQAPIGMIIFPQYQAGSPLEVVPISKAYALAQLLDNTFNVGLLGKEGFADAAQALANAKCFEVTYSSFDELLPWLDTQCRATS